MPGHSCAIPQRSTSTRLTPGPCPRPLTCGWVSNAAEPLLLRPTGKTHLPPGCSEGEAGCCESERVWQFTRQRLSHGAPPGPTPLTCGKGSIPRGTRRHPAAADKRPVRSSAGRGPGIKGWVYVIIGTTCVILGLSQRSVSTRQGQNSFLPRGSPWAGQCQGQRTHGRGLESAAWRRVLPGGAAPSQIPGRLGGSR